MILGYQVWKATVVHNKFFGSMKVSLELKNYGVAPMYFKWPVCLYLLDEQGQVLKRYQTDLDLTKLIGGATKNIRVKFQEEYLKESKKILAIGIENPENGIPDVYLDMKTPCMDKMYFLNVD